LGETSQSRQKQLLETEKDSLTIYQTKSPLFLKSNEYVKLHEKFTLHSSGLEHVVLESIWIWMFCYNVCWCCLPDYIFKQQWSALYISCLVSWLP